MTSIEELTHAAHAKLEQVISNAKASHKIRIVCLEGEPTIWIYKSLVPNREKPVIFSIEAAMGEIYRMVLGIHQPRSKVVLGADNTISGIVIEEVKGWNALNDLNMNFQKKHIYELGSILAAVCFFQSKDLHRDNVGYNENNQLVKIDHGLDMYSISGEYSSKISKSEIEETDFRVLREDILYLPYIRRENNTHIALFEKDSTRVSFIKNKDFINGKYKEFLQIVLIPDSNYAATIIAFFLDNDLDIAYHLAKEIINNKHQLQELLCQLKEFRDFIIKNPNFYHDVILKEIHEYNKTVADIDSERTINMSHIDYEYNKLVTIIKKESILALIEEKLEKLGKSTSSSPLKIAKETAYVQLKLLIKAIDIESEADEESLRQIFDRWLSTTYQPLEIIRDRSLQHKSYHEIFHSKRLSFDPRTPDSADFIASIKSLLTENRNPNRLRK